MEEKELVEQPSSDWLKPSPEMEKWLETHRKTTKTDGEGNVMIVDDPKYFNDEGLFHKHRKKPTNFTPKKKKRK
jgi:hypothetical protein